MSSVKDLHSSFWMEEDEWDDDNIPDGIYRWHVSGFDEDAVHCVRTVMGADEEV